MQGLQERLIGMQGGRRMCWVWMTIMLECRWRHRRRRVAWDTPLAWEPWTFVANKSLSSGRARACVFANAQLYSCDLLDLKGVWADWLTPFQLGFLSPSEFTFWSFLAGASWGGRGGHDALLPLMHAGAPGGRKEEHAHGQTFPLGVVSKRRRLTWGVAGFRTCCCPYLKGGRLGLQARPLGPSRLDWCRRRAFRDEAAGELLLGTSS